MKTFLWSTTAENRFNGLGLANNNKNEDNNENVKNNSIC